MAIADRQNLPQNLELLAAQRQIYREAKRLRSLRLAGSLGVAAAAPFMALWLPSSTTWLTGVATAWLLISRAVLKPTELRWNSIAAEVQEDFDVAVLGVQRGTRMDPVPPAKKVSGAARRHLKRHAVEREAALRDWYTPTGSITPPHDALICQQASLGWGASLHREWQYGFASFLAVVVVLGGVVAAVESLSFAQWFFALLVPSIPALVDGFDGLREHQRHVAKQDAGAKLARVCWDAAVVDPTTAASATPESALRNRRENVDDTRDMDRFDALQSSQRRGPTGHRKLTEVARNYL